MSSFSVNTLNQYNSSLKSWWQYCNENNIDFYEPNISQLLEYLTIKFNSGAGYSTLNTHRSSLSILLRYDVNENDCIKRFFKGLYRLNPPAPKYNSTWDPNIVLRYLENYFPNDSISLKELTVKTITLLALASAHRMQTMSLIKIKNINFDLNKITIKIDELIKTSRPGTYQPLIILPFIKENLKICPALALKSYIDRTSSLRNQDYLFISYQKPHKKVVSQTLSHWVKFILEKSGLDTSVYSAHSTRHASTSAAYRAGVNIEVIRKSAGWTESSKVFLKYYNRSISTSADSDFVNALFQ